MMADITAPASLSGLSDGEAKEFHSIFMTSFIGFVVVALIAHVLAWMWRPWLPGPEGYSSTMFERASEYAASVMPFIG